MTESNGDAGATTGATIIIPTRFASTRFPGKALAPIRGAQGVTRSLTEWSHRAATAVTGAARVIVATDDVRIEETVKQFGGDVMMTPVSCANGTERLAACLDRLPGNDLFVNLQGDALLTPPAYVDALIDHMNANPDAPVATVAVPCSPETYRHLADDAALGRAGGTTVVLDEAGNALYFSKRILPFLPGGAEPDAENPVLLHLGLYAYRRAALERYAEAGVTTLERVEGLEQLRFLAHRIPVSVLVMPAPDSPMLEVNNPSDVPLVEAILKDLGQD